MASALASVILRDGKTVMPMVGLGTFRLQGDECRVAVQYALQMAKYRRIDTAICYKNEAVIGHAIADAGIKREDVFITSKLSNYDMKKGEQHAYDACVASLERLNVSYVDLWLIHWPGATGLPLHSPRHADYRKDAWRSCERLLRDGKCRAIGVSNYTVAHLQELLTYANVLPYVNQIEMHPFQYARNKNLLAFCTKHAILVEAYSSLGQGHQDLINHPVVQQICRRLAGGCVSTPPGHDQADTHVGSLEEKKAERTQQFKILPSQVLLRWAIDRGFPINPKSSHCDRIACNGPDALEAVIISDEDLARLDALGEKEEDAKKFCWDSTNVK